VKTFDVTARPLPWRKADKGKLWVEKPGLLKLPLERNGGATMYQLSVYPIASSLWRWEIRCGGALLRCGTAPTRFAAERDVREIVIT
jgi:hypothetical protein